MTHPNSFRPSKILRVAMSDVRCVRAGILAAILLKIFFD